MSACENQDRVGPYHDGELSQVEAEAMREHLRQCRACRAELGRLEAVSAWLSGAWQEVPAGAVEGLRRSVQPRRDRRVLRLAEALTAVAAAVLLVCSALLWHRQRDAAAGAVRPPAEWEAAATAGPGGAYAAMTAGMEEDADTELARSILASHSGEGGQGYE